MFTLMTETRGLGEACRLFLLSEEMGLNTGHFERQIHAFVSNKFYSSLWPFFFLTVASSMFFRPCDIQGPYIARLECYFLIFSSMTTKV